MPPPRKRLRYALWHVWGKSCQWCDEPVRFVVSEVEHIIPKNSNRERIKELLDFHGLDDDFNLYAPPNLTISCARCNRKKGFRLPPKSPATGLLLERAAQLGPEAVRYAERMASEEKLDDALGIVLSHPVLKGLDSETKNTLKVAADRMTRASFQVGLVTAPTQIHPIGDYHDYERPELQRTRLGKNKVSVDEMSEIMSEWSRWDPDATDVIASAFDSGEGDLEGMSLREVTDVAYAPSIDLYLVQARFDVSYLFTDGDGVSGPADTEIYVNLWVDLDRSRRKVLGVSEDLWNTFG